MTNYQHYLATVERVYPVVLAELASTWCVECSEARSNQIKLVANNGTVYHSLDLTPINTPNMWTDKEPIADAFIEYIARGFARVTPLRQSVYRNNMSDWLERGLQGLQSIFSEKEALLQAVSQVDYPYPSKVKLDGDYFPCWVLGEKDNQIMVSVIDRRCGTLMKSLPVVSEQLVDTEHWFSAQVIDSSEDAIETAHHHITDLITAPIDRTDDEPKLADVITNPCASTISPVVSVMLMMAVVVAFFVILKIVLGF